MVLTIFPVIVTSLCKKGSTRFEREKWYQLDYNRAILKEKEKKDELDHKQGNTDCKQCHTENQWVCGDYKVKKILVVIGQKTQTVMEKQLCRKSNIKSTT